MYNKEMEELISSALADGKLTEKEKQVLFKKAQSQGIDLDEFEIDLDARLFKLQKAEKEKVEKSAPKSTKNGTVRTCPACGAMVPAFQGVCPECGYEFTEVDANASSKKLADALLNTNSESKQKRIIETFPLPNTKADLLEFLTALKPRISDFRDPLATSYFKKYQECIEKAKVTFPNDKLIAPFIASFEREAVLREKAQKKQERKQRIKGIGNWLAENIEITIFIIIILVVIIGISSFFIVKNVKKNKFESCKSSIVEAIQNNDYATAQRIFDGYEGREKYEKELKNIYWEKQKKFYDTSFTSAIENNDLVTALSIYEQFEVNCKKYNDEFYHYKDALGEKIISAYIKNNQVKEAEEFVETNYSFKNTIYNCMIDNGLYEEASKYYDVEDPCFFSSKYDKYYAYMKKCVKKMSSNGQKEKARQFVNRHASFFVDSNSQEYPVSKVKKNLNAIINAY